MQRLSLASRPHSRAHRRLPGDDDSQPPTKRSLLLALAIDAKPKIDRASSNEAGAGVVRCGPTEPAWPARCRPPPPAAVPAEPFSFAFFARWSVHRTIMMRVHFLEVPYLMMRRRHLDAPEPGVYDGRRGVDRP